MDEMSCQHVRAYCILLSMGLSAFGRASRLGDSPLFLGISGYDAPSLHFPTGSGQVASVWGQEPRLFDAGLCFGELDGRLLTADIGLVLWRCLG